MTSMLGRPRAVDTEVGAGGDAVPTARRHRRPGWRDPRVLVGLIIIAASVVLGAKVVGAADDTVGVWAARHDLAAGTTVGSDDVERVRIRFTGDDQADRYLAADRSLPRGVVLTRAVSDGELLPRAALDQSRGAVVEVPLSVDVDGLPATVRQGSRVDVWVSPQTATTADQLADATRVLDDVVVVEVPKAVDSLTPTGTRQVIVGVTRAQADDLGQALGSIAAGRVVITRRG
ncbi:hypothetical protein D9V37_08330 [Nocardioides mangrovicus]|uniref:SAF domain-containing protein n=1 Tax=Nocardioides mangrovicus TaxID=2478913 RepID=A0A3L8P540_9ACTN|nr:hypothetical protein [Nocardioides mangrovicus]RLV49883.1 hypothetical protein D9V37_08330 [Nocardioides mangrovicus]